MVLWGCFAEMTLLTSQSTKIKDRRSTVVSEIFPMAGESCCSAEVSATKISTNCLIGLITSHGIMPMANIAKEIKKMGRSMGRGSSFALLVERLLGFPKNMVPKAFVKAKRARPPMSANAMMPPKTTKLINKLLLEMEWNKPQ